MRVLLADDEPAVRSALQLLLDQEPDVEVVGQVGDGNALDAWLDSAEADLIIVDWELPGLPSFDLERLARGGRGRPKLIAMSGRSETRAPALAAGVDGFVSKTDPPEHLLALVRALRS
jgi:DNA-binding NarL/FixJ family response regulator